MQSLLLFYDPKKFLLYIFFLVFKFEITILTMFGLAPESSNNFNESILLYDAHTCNGVQ